jgi:5-methylcytosine-specific restriction endonuclease McrA
MKPTRARRLLVLDRDRWTCMMPHCLHPCTRAINRALDGTDSMWAPTLDHIVQKAQGGTHATGNLRAAHAWCNLCAGRRYGSPTLTVTGALPNLSAAPSSKTR